MNWFKKNIVGMLLIAGLPIYASQNYKQIVAQNSNNQRTVCPNKFVPGNFDNTYSTFPVSITNVNTKTTFYLPTPEWRSQIKIKLRGVVDKNGKYIFIHSDNPSEPKQNDVAFYYLDRLDLCQTHKTNDRGYTIYSPKTVFAYYETSCYISGILIPLIFGLTKDNNNHIYIIFPSIYSELPKEKSPENFFYNQYYKKNPFMELSAKKLFDNNHNVLKANLYIPKIMSTEHFCAYVFLYNTKNKTTDELTCVHYQAKQECNTVSIFNSNFVLEHLKKFLSQESAHSEENKLIDLFYGFLINKKNPPSGNVITLSKKSVQYGTVGFNIDITDTQCFEAENVLNVNIFVKICLTATLKGMSCHPPVAPIYAIFTTNLPFFLNTNDSNQQKKSIPLDWHVKFFHFLDSNKMPIDMKDLYFKADSNEMPGNDVRPIKFDTQHFENVSYPIPSYINNITDDGVEYEDNVSLPQIAYSSNNVLALPNTPEEIDRQNKEITVVYQPFSQIQPTELLRTVLQNMMNPIPNQQNEKINAAKQNSKENLFLFAAGLIAHIEILQNHVQALSEQVTALAGQHNGFFKLEKALDIQKGFVDSKTEEFKKLLNEAKKTSTEITDKQKDLVQNATTELGKNIEAKNQKVMEETQKTQLQEFNTLKNSFIEQSQELKVVQKFVETLNSQDTSLDKNITDVSNVRSSDLKTYDEKISTLEKRNFYLICGLIGSGVVSIGTLFLLYWYILQTHAKIALLEARLAL